MGFLGIVRCFPRSEFGDRCADFFFRSVTAEKPSVKIIQETGLGLGGLDWRGWGLRRFLAFAQTDEAAGGIGEIHGFRVGVEKQPLSEIS